MTVASGRLLLVHGWGAAGHSWNPIVERLRDAFEITAPDLPGHGGRQSAPERTIEAITAHLATRLNRADDRPAVVIGHSMGGQIAARLAADFPELVKALVVVDPAYGAGAGELATAPDQLADLRARGAASGVDFVDGAFPAGEPRALWQQARAQIARTPGPVLADLYESMYLTENSFGAEPASARLLARVEQPFLSLYSTESAARFFRSVRRTGESRIEVWPGATHYLHQQHPKRFVALLRDWLADIG